ncbi:adenosylcobinamide-GDP ribazoletransferase [Thiohalorhabdus sp.]|uniref:adenosylcobinamide-GDP ribazoletransferase n=1 Tax=Thiohalorhabdus sp. TaxID=3094134 RepID=UPI002FC331AD
MIPLRLAVQFLTRVPLGVPAAPRAADLGRSVAFYPLVGLGLGLVLAVVGALAGQGPGLLAAALLVTLWAAATGFLHLDGLADSADAWLGGQGDAERTLAILKDAYAGPAGVTAVVLVLLVKVAALAPLMVAGGVAALVLAPLLARAGTAALLLTTPYVRAGGLGEAAAANMPRPAVLLGVALSGLVALLVGGVAGLGALVAGGLVLLGLRWLMVRRIGGVTGDTLGAAIEVSEAVVLVVFAFGT